MRVCTSRIPTGSTCRSFLSGDHGVGSGRDRDAGAAHGGESSMNVQRRDLLLAVMLVSAIATPAFAQPVSPAAEPAGGVAGRAADFPDFSGTWAHPYLTGFEPPVSDPGPVRNR